jgi:MFS family permease
MLKERSAVSLLFFICGLNFASWATRIPDYKLSLHLSDADLGRVLLGLPFGSLVSLPIAGWLLTIYKSKNISLLAVIMYILVIPLIGLTKSQFTLFAVLFGFGMAGDILNIAMNTQVVGIENKLNKVVMSSFHAVFSLGLMFGSFLGGYLSNLEVSPEKHFIYISIVNIVSIPLFYPFLMKEDVKIEQKNNEKTSVFSLSPYLITLSIIALCGMLCEGAMADWITLYFKENLTENPFPSTIGFSAFAFAMVVGRFSGDILTMRFGLKNLLVVSGLLLALGIFITLIFPLVYLKILGCFITGLGIATIVPLVYSAAGNSGDLPPSVAIAGVSTIAYAGFLLGPVLIGYLSDFIGLPQALILLLILGLIAAFISKYSLRISKN